MDSQQPTNQRRANASGIITSGNVWSAVWYVAWPTAVNTLVQTAYNVINGIFVGRLPNAEQALAAIGIGGAVLMIQFALTMGISVGSAALVARFVGAGQHGDADEATGQSLTLAVLSGFLSSLPLVFAARPIVAIVGAQAGVAPLAGDYTAIIAWFSVPLFVYLIAQSTLRSAGDVKSPLYAGAATIAINVVLDYVLIFGVGPIPHLGVRGAAISTGISRIAGMLLTLWFLERSVLGNAFLHTKPRWEWWRRILNIGWPAVLQNIVWTGASVMFIRILGFLPGGQATAAQAALTVALRIESIAFMPGVAYATAATPLVGQNLGAGKLERAVHSAWVATGQAVFIMSAVAIMFLAAPKWLALIFTSDPAVVPLVVTYLRINALSEPLLAVGMVMRGALQGAGETRVPFALTLLTLWVIRIPLTYALAVPLGLGATGAWIAMSSSTFLSGMVMASYFRWGRWREVQV